MFLFCPFYNRHLVSFAGIDNKLFYLCNKGLFNFCRLLIIIIIINKKYLYIYMYYYLIIIIISTLIVLLLIF